MKVEKISKQFNFYKDVDKYILDLGLITKETNREVILNISDIDSKNFQVKVFCGCTKVEVTTISNTEVVAKITYKNCDKNISKTVVLAEKNKQTEIKIKGNCN